MESSFPAVQRLLNLPTHSYEGVPTSNQQPIYPVILFFTFRPERFTAQIEELASHGYIIVGLSRAYYFSDVVLPDGKVAAVPSHNYFNMNLLKVGNYFNPVADAKFALDQLAALNAASRKDC